MNQESTYLPTIGLEIHAELKTETKMFCRSKNDPDETRPNVNICPVCMAHPGTLPVLNSEAIRHVLKVGHAIGATLADYTEWDRKNYFYPDLPKGYQLSQFEFPLVQGGKLNGIAITRIHLEEDTARSIHDDATGATLIDYNRAGVPLMELVTEPDIHSATEAGAFARELQLLLRTLGVSEANMEKGEMRVEANISLGRDGKLGTKVEIKNLNSFKAMERAVAYEIERQAKVLDKGGVILQETLGWDDAKQKTFTQRSKEGSADYRYFPDPDIPKLVISQIEGLKPEVILAGMPTLPWQKRDAYLSLGLRKDDAELYVRDNRFGSFFDAVASSLKNEVERVRIASNYIGTDLVKIIRDIEDRDSVIIDKIDIAAESFAELVDMIVTNTLSSRGAKDVLGILSESGGKPSQIAKEKGLLKESGTETLGPIVAKVIADNPAAADSFKAGKKESLQYLIGQGMKASRGSGDPAVFKDLFEKALA